MLIEYVHKSEPTKTKTHDTEKAYKNMQFAIHDPDTKLYKKTQLEFDNITLDSFKRDKERGIILYYKILEARENAI